MNTPTPADHDQIEKPASARPTHPLWARPGVLACLVAAVLAYGSLIPFDFAWSSAVQQAGGSVAAITNTFASPTWVSASDGQSVLGVSYGLSDLLMNVLLYLPLGVTLRIALRMRWRCWPAEMFGTVGLAFALSWSVESLQGLTQTRVASLQDVMCNTVGAFVAALFAMTLWNAYKTIAFKCYCRLASISDRLRRWGQRPGVVMAIAVANALVIGLWYIGEVRRSFVSDEASLAMPFERAFDLPYDLGALLLGQALLAYASIGCLLLLLTYTGAKRIAMRWVVLAVVLLAFATELSRAASQNDAPDITGPLLALSAGVIMTVTVYSFSLAVKRSNRRHDEQSYGGSDRRRRPHEYV